ncbi:hypothetical protein BGZ76_007258 [Entomortierella beljakovae]|nr:hypothetical protein BGZ76_007258 [Entomortierella beljakovae]
MVPGPQSISLSEEALKAPSIPIHALLTPPLDSVPDPSSDTLAPPIVGVSPKSTFPIKVAILPNKGRSYVATRTIQPNELIFVAEAFGTTMCDPWLDCGVCHYCWATIQDRKTQIRLPRSDVNTTQGNGNEKGKGKGSKPATKKKQETIMVFCDEKCLRLYGPDIADTICRVEQKIRRTWDRSSQWKLKPSTITRSTPTISTISTTSLLASQNTHYSIFVQQALSIAKSSKAALDLSDQDLSCFLNNVWNALDAMVDEQELLLLNSTSSTTTTTSTIAAETNSDDSKKSPQKKRKYTQKNLEELYPNLAVYLLEGYNITSNISTLASKMADDDCEIARLISEVLYRRQQDMKDPILSTTPPSNDTTNELSTDNSLNSIIHGERATFADYCAMQSNELAVFRQNLTSDMDEFGQHQEIDFEQEPMEMKEEEEEENDSRAEKNNSNYHKSQWQELLSILPIHLLGCFYIYLRLRDAYLLLNREEIQKETIATTKSNNLLFIDNNLFRTIVYAEIANSFGIRDSSDELLGFAVFPRACFFNHSCRPNIEKKRRQGHKTRQMEYWSTCMIEQEEECCISYGDISTGLAERQSRLEDMYFFKCSCIRCSEEEKESE